ncbi:hypothetical protein N8791_06315 [Gammaproteobacteria bacterium]|nr:hypothetical protein [Gammaproteobacteria bacterium]
MSNLINIRRLNIGGIKEMTDDMGVSPKSLPRSTLLEDHKMSEIVSSGIKIDTDKVFADRMECAEYIFSLIKSEINNKPELWDDIGFWSWLALVYVNQFAPKIFGIENYVLDLHANRVTKHCVRQPCLIIQKIGIKKAKTFCGLDSKGNPTMASKGDLIDQIWSRDYITKSNKLLELVVDLYLDVKNGRSKTNSATEPKWDAKGYPQGPQGSARRLAPVLQQLDFTHNLEDCSIKQLRKLLGPEFAKF